MLCWVQVSIKYFTKQCAEFWENVPCFPAVGVNLCALVSKQGKCEPDFHVCVNSQCSMFETLRGKEVHFTTVEKKVWFPLKKTSPQKSLGCVFSFKTFMQEVCIKRFTDMRVTQGTKTAEENGNTKGLDCSSCRPSWRVSRLDLSHFSFCF